MTATRVDPQAILKALECGTSGCTCAASTRKGSGLTHCAAHQDLNPSLNVSVRDDGTALLYCHAGCEQADVIAALRDRHLWPNSSQTTFRRSTDHQLRDASGQVIAIHRRISKEDGRKEVVWLQPDGTPGLRGTRTSALPLYGIDRLNNAASVVIAEGEKATDALLALDIAALGTVTGAKGTPDDDVLRDVLGVSVIYLWPDHDDEGRMHMDRIAARLVALGHPHVRVVRWPDAPPKGDAADAPSTLVQALIDAAEQWTPGRHPDDHHVHVPIVCDGDEHRRRDSGFIDLSRHPDPGPIQFTVEGFIPSGYTTNLYANSGQAKSIIVLDLGRCIITGTPFLSKAVIQGPVVYLDWELDADMQRRRWGELCRGAGIKLPDGLLYRRMVRSFHESYCEVAEYVAQVQPALVIIDSYAKAAGNRPNEVPNIVQFYADCDRLGTVIVIDHQARGGEGGYADKWEYGNSYKRHLARSSWQVERLGSSATATGIILRNKKSNFGPPQDDIHATLTFGSGEDNQAFIRLDAVDNNADVMSGDFGLRSSILRHLATEKMAATDLDGLIDSAEIGTIRNTLTELKKVGLIREAGRRDRAALYELTPPLRADGDTDSSPPPANSHDHHHHHTPRENDHDDRHDDEQAAPADQLHRPGVGPATLSDL